MDGSSGVQRDGLWYGEEEGLLGVLDERRDSAMADAEGLGTIIEMRGLGDASKNDRAWRGSMNAFQEVLTVHKHGECVLQKVRK